MKITIILLFFCLFISSAHTIGVETNAIVVETNIIVVEANAIKFFVQGNFLEASTLLEQIILVDDAYLPAHYWLGRCKYELGDLYEASQEFIYVMDRKSNSVDSLYWLGRTFERANFLKTAEDIFREIIIEYPEYKQANESLISLLHQYEIVNHQGDVLQNEHNRISLDIVGLDIGPEDIYIFSNNVYDYTFNDPPVDWQVGAGIWETTNRWTCSPQWSWYGGYAEKGLAAIWNKRVFEGDIIVEAYMAFKMGVNKGEGEGEAPYRNPNDMNVSICGDGMNLSSGYSFIYGGELNSVTCIMKQNTILVENRDDSALLPVFEDGMPNTYDFHRRWWAIKICKRGNLLQFYVDNKLLCEAYDDKPLTEGHVAIWTMNNGLILSRIKIYYEREQIFS